MHDPAGLCSRGGVAPRVVVSGGRTRQQQPRVRHVREYRRERVEDLWDALVRGQPTEAAEQDRVLWNAESIARGPTATIDRVWWNVRAVAESDVRDCATGVIGAELITGQPA